MGTYISEKMLHELEHALLQHVKVDKEDAHLSLFVESLLHHIESNSVVGYPDSRSHHQRHLHSPPTHSSLIEEAMLSVNAGNEARQRLSKLYTVVDSIVEQTGKTLSRTQEILTHLENQEEQEKEFLQQVKQNNTDTLREVAALTRSSLDTDIDLLNSIANWKSS
ncbi:uncharacterized protein C5L36_0A12590 [Pichia kudriavzevii]|uniref:Uncharacterized protein n=1 Tax=Pichia kudriavzevii TaxID=4909 RepID=A0A2U9R060_PICKU|nr:uncharacterized protein C5L36_0A12590 [Pichia kudriavzevii]AWU74683.1 hypothetical protein C5L36_0A12590 [Pichia kudriavzevii]